MIIIVFHERLKQTRISKNITQKQMAEFLDISFSQYQKYEYGKHEPNIKNLILISKILNVSVDYLIGNI